MSEEDCLAQNQDFNDIVFNLSIFNGFIPSHCSNAALTTHREVQNIRLQEDNENHQREFIFEENLDREFIMNLKYEQSNYSSVEDQMSEDNEFYSGLKESVKQQNGTDNDPSNKHDTDFNRVTQVKNNAEIAVCSFSDISTSNNSPKKEHSKRIRKPSRKEKMKDTPKSHCQEVKAMESITKKNGKRKLKLIQKLEEDKENIQNPKSKVNRRKDKEISSIDSIDTLKNPQQKAIKLHSVILDGLDKQTHISKDNPQCRMRGRPTKKIILDDESTLSPINQTSYI